MHVSHQQCHDALSALLDGEEASVGLHELMGHLDGCPDCSAWLETATRVNAGVRSLPVLASGLGERVVDQVDVHLCACRTGGACRCGRCRCGPGCTCHGAH
ncbi:MAG: zf-HC2 domain-containing protein [Micropruina sp.]|nr:zf-HC2 domain-containing protein [Micropruina sp.]